MVTSLPTTPPAAITDKGTILGTFQYMAPEQLEGHEADSRTDLFAFGCVLYEMATGRKAFQGKTQVSLIGAILKDDPPPVSSVQALSPAAFDFAVRKCLAKDPDRRWQTASDLVSQLEWIAQAGAAATADGNASAIVPRVQSGVRPMLAAGAAVALAVFAGVAAWFLKPRPVELRQPLTRFSITLPPDQLFTRLGRHVVAISPDGTKVVYVANQQLYLRGIDQLEATPIRGTKVDPVNPFFSPDGQWVGFYAVNQLRKIAIAGGAAVKLCDATNPFGVTWTGDRILFGQGARGIMEVPANGGVSNVLVKVEDGSGELAHGPQLLPGGDAVLFTLAKGQNWEEGRAVIYSLKTGQRKVLLEGAADARYIDTGHILYGHDATLLAVPFDVRRLDVTGGPVVVAEGVTEAIPTGSMQFALSETGTAAFVPGAVASQRSLAWVDRKGSETAIAIPTRAYVDPRLSPDGKRVAVAITDQEQAIWIGDLTGGSLSRLTFGRSGDVVPHWSHDGRRVFYSSVVNGERRVLWKAADGTGPAEPLTTTREGQIPRSASPDGRFLLVSGPDNANANGDMSLVSLEGKHELTPLLHSAFDENFGEISPDGKWIAYTSNESGAVDIYVRAFPEVDRGPWQISVGGGNQPRWSRDGRELFYRSSGGVMMAAAVRTDGARFDPATPVTLSSRTDFVGFDVAPDGRFLIVKLNGMDQRPQIVIVQHWIDELKARTAKK
jgi:serine/threonine-protein kinase